MSAFPRDDSADVGIEDHREQENASQEHPEERGFDTREEKPLLHHTENQRPERRADHRAVTAGQQGAADDHGNNRLELFQQTTVGGGGTELHNLAGREDRRAKGGEHEHQDLDPIHRHTGVARRLGIAARGVNPVAELGARQQDVGEDDQDQRPDDQHGHAVDDRLSRAAAGNELADQTEIRQPDKKPVEDLAAEQGREPIALRLIADPADDGLIGCRDGREDGQATQDIQKCQRHDEGRQAGADHEIAVQPADGDGDDEGSDDRDPHGKAPGHRHQRNNDPGKADHGADRKIELTGDHQETGAGGNDRELGGDDPPVQHTFGGKHARIPGDQ